MINVYTVFIKGSVYTKEWVYKLKRGIELNCTIAHNFYCLTNEQLPGINTIKLEHSYPGWWSKMELCRPDIKGRMHYLDLDTIITGNIDFFLEERESLLFRDWLYPSQRESAMFVLNEDDRTQVWDFWTSDVAGNSFNFVGDGRVYNFCIGKSVSTLQEKHPGRIYTWKAMKQDHIPMGCKVLVFSGRPKQCDFKEDHWIRKHYW